MKILMFCAHVAGLAVTAAQGEWATFLWVIASAVWCWRALSAEDR